MSDAHDSSTSGGIAAGSDPGTGGRRTPPFPFAELARVLLIPIVAVALFVFLFMRQGPSGPETNDEGLLRIGLVQKDAKFQPIPRDKGGASGSVWYSPSGPELEFQLRAEGLKPRKRYLVELAVDSLIYTIASRPADARGDLALDTTLTRFAEGVCVGPNYDEPRRLDGRHTIRFWVKADGNPRSGTGREWAPQFTAGQDLPCSGNGDGDYGYVLLENEAATYAGPGAGAIRTGPPAAAGPPPSGAKPAGEPASAGRSRVRLVGRLRQTLC